MSAVAHDPALAADTGARTVARALPRLAGRRVLVLNWRDVRHPQAGGAEAYIHEIARRWVAAGTAVTMLTAAAPGLPRHEVVDGVDVRRAGGRLGVYARTAAKLLAYGHRYDVVVDCQNGIPFFAPLFTAVPVVQVVHHVHQEQFATVFNGPVAAVGRTLEGRVARWVYREHRSVAVSTSTRREMRQRLGFGGIIDIVPNGGSVPVTHDPARSVDPTLVLVTRLVPHKRVDLLLRSVADARVQLPALRVEIVGGGPERERLAALVDELGLADAVTLHGRLSDTERDALLTSAWLTTSTSQGEGWGCSVLEAAALGVPCLAVRVPGIRDSVIDGRTGWLVDDPGDVAGALVAAVRELEVVGRAGAFATACRGWAARFTWERSAELLAASVVAATGGEEPLRRRARRRSRTDMTTLAWFTHPDPAGVLARLRLTDEVQIDGDHVAVILRGCDDLDAFRLLDELGARDVTVRPARGYEVLAGPDVGSDPAGAR